MAKVLTIGSDRTIFEDDSAARARILEYGKLFDELRIIIFTTGKIKAPSVVKISENVWLYPTKSFSRWFYIWDAARIGRKIVGADGKNWVVSSQDPFESGLASLKVVEKTGAKLHIQVHTDFLSPYFKKQSLLNRIRLFIARKVLPKANGIRVVSPRIKSSLLQAKSWQLKANPVVLPIFIDTEKLKSRGEIFNFKEKHPDWSFAILMVCRLEAEKNIGLALRAVSQVVKKYPKAGLLIVGSGRKELKLKILASFLGLNGNVEFIPYADNVAPFYLGANTFLQTSNYEGYGMALLEAAAAGLPIVCTDAGVVSYLLKDGENAFVCPIGDAGCLASKIIHLIEDNQTKEMFSTNVKNIFTSESFPSKEKYLQKYKESIEHCSSKDSPWKKSGVL